MQTFNHSLLDTLYYDDTEAEVDDPCKVTLDDDRIEVRYDDEDDEGGEIHVVWIGVELAPGHYSLERAEAGGKATLHRFPTSMRLEGFWTMDGERGMWLIKLR